MAIVTGASSGVGLGITRALLQRGFSVVANSRTVSKSKELPAFSRALAMEYVAEGIRANTSLESSCPGARHRWGAISHNANGIFS